ncbi:MAG TPA: histidine phosphatase family protein [Candidatus Saccharimonadales bacterium]|nr:histidine phosphatase family protein [Candidatus Saccharimonadales bacterium]
MPTTIFFVRHGQSENLEKINYGRMPGYPLSETGTAQAEADGKYFADKKITAIFTSPLERSFQTADIIAKACPSATVEHVFDLNEAEATHWQGMKVEELFTNSFYETFVNDPDADIGTENLTEVAARMEKTLQEILSKHKGQNIVCVSHEFPILALKLKLEGKPLQSMKTYHLPMGGVLSFTFDDSGKFVKTEEVSV